MTKSRSSVCESYVRLFEDNLLTLWARKQDVLMRCFSLHWLMFWFIYTKAKQSSSSCQLFESKV
jgi:hypothetical protein